MSFKVYNFHMKQKSARKRNWKKILIVMSFWILGVFGADILGVFLWMQTWKTYQFPNGQGYIRYPSILFTWPRVGAEVPIALELITLSNHEDPNKPFPNGNLFFTITRYMPTDNFSAAKEFESRSQSDFEAQKSQDPEHSNEVSSESLNLGQEKASLIETNQSSSKDREYLVAHKQYVYQFTGNVSGLKIFRIIYNWIV